MVFSSITFLFYFFPVVFVVYYVLKFSTKIQNLWLLAASIFFYAWGEPVYVLLMAGSILVNWGIGLLLGLLKKNSCFKRICLIAGCICNLGMLGIFKYTGFITETINILLEEELLVNPEIKLPIGISFFTFQALSYLMDVYTGKVKAQKNLFNLGLYIAFFPQLVAGPIVRYTSMEKQIYERKTSWKQVSEGVCRFTEGLFKKILLANQLAIVADHIFELTQNGSTDIKVPIMLGWLGAIAYTLQLYYDFSSYSDMAIGLGKIFGFTFPENFRYPFTAKSVREFMAKWHISLASWFNQYVYKPLGGAGKGNEKMAFNLFLVWLLTGIWHGAAWNYIWWGMYFFLFIIFENVIQMERIEGHDGLRRFYMLFVVVIAMVIFRCEGSKQLFVYMSALFGLYHNGFYSDMAVMFLKEYGLVFMFAIMFTLPLRQYVEFFLEKRWQAPRIRKIYHVCYILGMSACFVLCVSILAKGGYNPFIYFNF